MQCLMGCNDESKSHDKIESLIIHGSFTVEEDDVEPPAPGFKSRFKTLDEWLAYICKNERPTKSIEAYNFGLFEGENEYTLFLTGTNTYEISKEHTQIRIEFYPTEMYFSLPEHEHQGLNRAQVYAHITSELKKFMKTKECENSLFHDAEHIKTEWNGESLSIYKN